MEDHEKQEKELLQCLITIPKKMMFVHGIDNSAEFLLHSLCSSGCLNVTKAAFLVDNPDFDQLRGVAGFVHTEAYQSEKDHWYEPENFTKHMGSSMFNQRVRSLLQKSVKKEGKTHAQSVEVLAKELSFSNPLHASWPMKYDNQGLLLFEVDATHPHFFQEHLESMIHLFGFCPVF